MALKHIVSSLDLTKAEYDEILRRGKKFLTEGISPDVCRGKVVATLFFQPSTRTMMAFQSGMLRAGGGWIGVTGEQGLSMEKGESFEDTIREFSSFADCIALRHPDDNASERAVASSFVPILNCGGGSKEHAVSAAMILVVLEHFLKRPLQGLRVGLYGTPQINRAAKSIVPILGMYGIDLVIDDLGNFPLPPETEAAAKKNGIKSITYDKLDNFIGDVDLLFVTRGLQKGIFPEGTFPKEKEELILKTYTPITTEHMKKLRKDAYLYMIKPRIFEIDTAVDPDPRAIHTKREPFVEACLAVLTHVLGIAV